MLSCVASKMTDKVLTGSQTMVEPLAMGASGKIEQGLEDLELAVKPLYAEEQAKLKNQKDANGETYRTKLEKKTSFDNKAGIIESQFDAARGRVPTKLWEIKWLEPTLAENDQVALHLNLQSFDIVQYPGKDKNGKSLAGSAGMSAIHILGVPKKALNNVVGWQKEDAPVITNIMDLFQEQWDREETVRCKTVFPFRESMIDLASSRVFARGTDPANDDPSKFQHMTLALRHLAGLREIIMNSTSKDFKFGIHVYPDNSIPDFHLHVVLAEPSCRKYSTTEHDMKTKAAIEVKKCLEKSRTDSGKGTEKAS